MKKTIYQNIWDAEKAPRSSAEREFIAPVVYIRKTEESTKINKLLKKIRNYIARLAHNTKAIY